MSQSNRILKQLREETGRDVTWIELRHGIFTVHVEIVVNGKHYLAVVSIPFTKRSEDAFEAAAVKQLKAILDSEES